MDGKEWYLVETRKKSLLSCINGRIIGLVHRDVIIVGMYKTVVYLTELIRKEL